MENNPTTGYDIWVLRLADRKAQPFLRTPFNESVPRFSPDGRWLAYISNESSRYEVYAQPYPGPGGKWQISTEGGTEPTWNSTGGSYSTAVGQDDGRGHCHAAELRRRQASGALEGRYVPTPATSPNYDVSPTVSAS